MRHTRPRFIFLGDCNTCGADALTGDNYPSRVATRFDALCTNLGITMSTTREGLKLSSSHTLSDFNAIFIQYGLVDSWRTIRCAPYVLYYPDTFIRKRLRSWVKKWKKYGRRIGLGRLFGMQHQVPIAEYRMNLIALIEQASGQPVFLIETPPNKEESRNPSIRRYNACLLELSELYANVHCVRIYSSLECTFSSHYCDPTHLSEAGQALVAETVISKVKDVLPIQETDNA